MAAEIITINDLKVFKNELLNDLKVLLNVSDKTKEKKWLKSPEVRKLLKISRGKLLTLRVNGTLPFSKIGSVIYYDYDDIKKAINDNRRHNK